MGKLPAKVYHPAIPSMPRDTMCTLEFCKGTTETVFVKIIDIIKIENRMMYVGVIKHLTRHLSSPSQPPIKQSFEAYKDEIVVDPTLNLPKLMEDGE